MLSSSANSPTYGTSVRFSAKVSSRHGIPTGSVDFLDGIRSLGIVPLNSSGSASITLTSLARGKHVILAKFIPNKSSFMPSISKILVIKVVIPSSTSLMTSAPQSILWAPVTFTASVQSPAGAPTGTVTFNDGPNSIGQATLDATGAATLTTSNLATGNHTLQAVFTPSSRLIAGSASSPLTQQIIPGKTTVPTDNVNGQTPGLVAGQFAVSPDGAGVYTYPIWTPAGRRGIQPNLALVYNSQNSNSNGPIGVGWAISGLSSITRCKRDIARDGQNAAIQFSSNEKFCLDGQRLVAFDPTQNPPTNAAYGQLGTQYRTEEDRFIRIINGPTDAMGPVSFEVDYKDGRRLFYGLTSDSRLEGFLSNGGRQVRLTWALNEIRDVFGNNLTIEYGGTVNGSVDCVGVPNSANVLLPCAIHYTGAVDPLTGNPDKNFPPQRTVTFDYEDRCNASITPICDTLPVYIAGLEVNNTVRLHNISLSAPNPSAASLVRTYEFAYQASSSTGRTLLSSISECDANQARRRKPRQGQVCQTPTTFSYSAESPTTFWDFDTGIHDSSASGGVTSPLRGYDRLGKLLIADLNGDGCDDVIFPGINTGAVDTVNYLLSACYDATTAEGIPYPTPTPGNMYQLIPSLFDNSSLTSAVFTQPVTYYSDSPQQCEFGQQTCTYNQLLSIDLHLDGRSDLLNYQVKESRCDKAWCQSYAVNAFLDTSAPPSAWNPQNLNRLFQGDTVPTLAGSSTPGSWITAWKARALFFHSIYVGDLTGNGFPDLVYLTPNGWFYQLNRGRSATQNCVHGDPSDACLFLEPEAPFPSAPIPTEDVINVFVADVLGEGNMRLILRDKNDSHTYVAYGLNYGQTPFNLGLEAGEFLSKTIQDPTDLASQDFLLDFNGDGLPSVVSVPYSNPDPSYPYSFIRLAINTGNGFQARQGAATSGQITIDATFEAVTLNYDGDGTQGLVLPVKPFSIPPNCPTLDGIPDLQVLEVFHRAFVPWQIGLLTPLNDQNGCPIPHGSGLVALDAKGGGLGDFAQVLQGALHVYIRQGQKPDLLQAINDRGAQTTVTYAPITSKSVYHTTVAPGVANPINGTSIPPVYAPTSVANRGVWVVKSYSYVRAVSGSKTDVSTFTYSYADGRQDLHGRGWLGFGSVTVTDKQSGAVTTTTYDNSTMWGSFYPYAGRPQEVDTLTTLPDSGLLHERLVQTSYCPPPGNPQQNCPPQEGTPQDGLIVVQPHVVTEKVIEAQAPTLTVNLVIAPSGDPGRADLLVDGSTTAANVGNGGTTGALPISLGQHSVGARIAAGTDPSLYSIDAAGGDCQPDGSVVIGPTDHKLCTLSIGRKEAVNCFVFDKGPSNEAGPSNQIYISGRNQDNNSACIPDQGKLGICRKMFGKCVTAQSGTSVYFKLFDDGYQNIVGGSDTMNMAPGPSGQGHQDACIANDVCRKWFGRGFTADGRTITCSVNDDSGNSAGPSDAIFIPDPNPSAGAACIPGVTSPTCYRWFGRCQAQ
jgi:hypothetical protein